MLSVDESPRAPQPGPSQDEALRLEAMQQLRQLAAVGAVQMIDWANHKPENQGRKPKIGGHQASSLSSVDILCALYLSELRACDRVAVKPHAAPVVYALQHLMGRLSTEDMGRLREKGGPQPYPTKLKAPAYIDYTTSSEALGVACTVYDAYEARVQSDQAEALGLKAPVDARYYALCGDGELTEGQCDESLYDAGRWRLDNLCWVVDLNRQSLDRVMDDSGRLAHWVEAKFRGQGFEVIELRWGRVLQRVFAQGDAGRALQTRLESLDDQHLQVLLAVDGATARVLLTGDAALLATLPEARRQLCERFLSSAPARDGAAVAQVLADRDDAALWQLLGSLGGHDLEALCEAFAKARGTRGRPTCIIAHTIKGQDSALRAHPENHGALMDEAALAQMQAQLLEGIETQGARFPKTVSGSPADVLIQARREVLYPDGARTAAPRGPIPDSLAQPGPRIGVRSQMSTGEAFQSMNLALLRTEVAPLLHFAAPDVGQTTHLGPVIRAGGVYSPNPREHLYAWLNDERRSAFDWRESAQARFHSLAIAEGNAMLLAYVFGRDKLRAEGKRPLVPVVTVYDKFVERGLNQLDYACYSGARFILVGVPSGTGLSREAATHQSIQTPRIVMDLPGIVSYEPAFAEDLRAIYAAAITDCLASEGEATYLRLSTQSLAQRPLPVGHHEGALRGAYWIRHPERAPDEVTAALPADAPRAHIFATGRKVQCALQASETLAREQGVCAAVLNVTSYERLWREWDRFNESAGEGDYALHALIPAGEVNRPLVLVGDFVPSVAEWVSAATHRVRNHRFLGPRRNGEAGDLESIDRLHGMHHDDIVRAVREELDRGAAR